MDDIKPANPAVADTSYVMRAAASLLKDILAPLASGISMVRVIEVADELNERAKLIREQAQMLASGFHAQDSLGDCLRAIKEVRE